MRIIPNRLCCALLLFTPAALAQAPPAGPPDGAVSPRPQVTITQQGDEVIKEYRIGGKLYMIEVDPAKGYPYYLVDSDGDGQLETRHVELTEDLLIPSWTLFRWK